MSSGRSLNAGMFSSEFDDWNTPEEVLAPARAFAGPDGIGLDPCSNAQSIVRARVEWRLERGEDGLGRDWNGFGLVWVNPPYGDEIGWWMRKMDREAAHLVEILALVPHRTDPEWYQQNVRRVAAKCEWAGRLQHPRGRKDRSQLDWLAGPANDAEPLQVGSAPFPSVILYWGERVREFRRAFSPFGKVWR